MSVQMHRFLVVALLLGGRGANLRAAGEPAQQRRAQARVDVHGDPLPPDALARLGTVRFRHTALIATLGFSPDGKALLSGGFDGAVSVWESATGRPLRSLGAFPDKHIVHVAFCPDGKRVVVASRRLPVLLCETATGKRLRAFGEEHSGLSVTAAALSPDGKTLAYSTSAHKLRDGKIRLWDVATGKELRQLAGADEGEFFRLAFAPDGKALASGDDRGRLRLWATATGALLHEWQAIRAGLALEFSPRGDTLAAGVGDRVCLLNVETWTPRRYLTVPTKGPGTLVHALAFSPEGKTLACGIGHGAPLAGTLCLLDVATGKELHRSGRPMATVLALAFAPDGKTLATGNWDYCVRLWDVATGKERRAPAGHQHAVEAVAFARGGKVVVSAGYDHTLRLWDLATSKERYRVEAFRPGYTIGVTVSPDGSLVATTGGREAGIRLWDAASGKPLRALGQSDDVWGPAAFSPDGKQLVSIGPRGENNHLCLWDVATGKETHRFAPCAAGFRAVAFAPDGKTVASGDNGGQLRLWDARTGKELRRLSCTGGVLSVAFSPDGRSVAGASSDEHAVQLWEAATGRQRCRWRPDGEPRSLAYAPDGRTLACGGDFRGIHLWDVTAGTERGRFAGHQGDVSLVAFAPDGDRLASCGADTTVLLWDAAALIRRTRRRPVALPAKELEALWRVLGSGDAERAFAAVGRLGASPERTSAFLCERLRPVPRPDEQQRKRIRGWIHDLDSARFGVRNAAMRELQRLGEMVVPELGAALPRAVGLEARRRLEDLLARLEEPEPTGEALRGLRAVEALEYAGTKEARRLLEQLAGGAAHARLTREARGSLERLARRGR